MTGSSGGVPSNLSQQQCHQAAIACVQSRLARYQNNPIELRAQLQPHLETLGGLQQKLTLPLLQVAVFGLVSRGKSAVLNALFGEPIFPTGPLNGVTQWPRSVRWSIPLPDLQPETIQIELIDTPGLDEVSGAVRATMAETVARCADLILFVTAGPPLPIEEEALAELATLAKPLMWLVNKADLYPDLIAEQLYQALPPSLQSVLSPRTIVLTAAAPAPIQVRHEWPDGRIRVDWELPPPQVEDLRQTLLTLLHREGLYLLALNVLLQVQATEQHIVEAITLFYAQPIQSLQWRLWGLKAGLVSIMPWTGVDLLVTLGADIIQVRQLSQICGLPITSHNIRQLWHGLLISLLCMTVADLPFDLQGWVFEGVTGAQAVASVVIQAALAVYGAYRVGQSAQVYLSAGATWDSQGPSLLLQTLLTALSPEMVIYQTAQALTPNLASEGPTLIRPSE